MILSDCMPKCPPSFGALTDTFSPAVIVVSASVNGQVNPMEI